MMFRKSLFWLHLIAGLVAGVVIFVMCVTGALLAFERNITDYAEREMRYAERPAGAAVLAPQTVIDRLMQARPDVRPTSMSISGEDNAAWVFGLGRQGQIFVNPYTGEVLGEGNRQVRGVMTWLRDFHRYLGLSGEGRPVGKALTGAGNILFLFLAVSGLYIWMPRRLEWRRMRPLIWFRKGVSGRARNFNLHAVIGFWTSLVLIALTLTAIVISYQWASNLLFRVADGSVPPQNAPRENTEAYALPQNIDPAWQAAMAAVPGWKSISLRLPLSGESAAFTIDEGIYWNTFGRSNLTVDAASGETTKWEPYGNQSSGRQLRSWFRFTHTGETGGIVGQIIAFAACIGGAFLVYTGFALGFRRFRNYLKRRRPAAQLP